jgi:hypothetical protein
LPGSSQGARRAVRERGLVALAAITALALAARPLAAAEPDAGTVGAVFNWYYAAVFGTGVYTIAGEHISVLTIPVSYTVREPSDAHWGLRLTLPVSAALANFDLYRPDPGSIEDVDVAALSLLPGAELRIPIGENWRVHPFANVGRGRELNNDVAATIYQLGVSTVYDVSLWHWPEVALGVKAIYAGYRVSGTETTPIARVSLGVSTLFPLDAKIDATYHSNIGIQLITTSYVTDLKFRVGDFTLREIQQEYEAALTFGVRPAIRLFGKTFDRIGLSYVVGNDGLHGVRLVTEFPF